MSEAPSDLRLADLLAALSLTTDLAMGHPPEKAIRACVVATEVARRLDLPENEVADVYYTTLLKHLGCTAPSHEVAHMFGPDDLALGSVAERADVTSLREMLELFAVTGKGAGAARPVHLVKAATAGKKANRNIAQAVCEVAALIAGRIGLGEGVRTALYQTQERWDGKGDPQSLRGEDIALAARIAEPSTQAVIFHRMGGADAVRVVIGKRSGGWFDPDVVRAFLEVGPGLLDAMDEEDPWQTVLEAEAEPVRRIEPGRLERVAEAFADMVDLQTTFTLGHSTGVADLAADAAKKLGLADPGSVRLAGLLHDLGRTSVPTGTWERRRTLSTSQWERVRMHAYHTERILARSSALEPIARAAGMHHDRQDGSGYHHGASGSEIPPEARVLAAADVYQALTQDRPHRDRRTPEEAAEVLAAEAGSGRIDPEAARAVTEAAGHRPSRSRTSWPNGLSDREVEVLRLVTAGLSNKQISRSLVISPRTAEHHVQHVYTKIGTSTRAGAAMFAMEHGLVR